MFTIASCILVAACINVSQVVVAVSLSNPLGSLESLSPLGLLLNKAQDKDEVSNESSSQTEAVHVLRNIIGYADETVQKIRDGMSKIGESIKSRLSTEVQRFKDKSEQFLKEIQNVNISLYNSLFKKGHAVAKLVSDIISCISNEIEKILASIESFIDAIKSMLETFTQEIFSCMSSPIIPLVPCVVEASKYIPVLEIKFADAINVLFNVIFSSFSKIKMCIIDTVFDFT